MNYIVPIWMISCGAAIRLLACSNAECKIPIDLKMTQI